MGKADPSLGTGQRAPGTDGLARNNHLTILLSKACFPLKLQASLLLPL